MGVKTPKHVYFFSRFGDIMEQLCEQRRHGVWHGLSQVLLSYIFCKVE